MRSRTVLARAAVHLEGILVREDVNLNARKVAGNSGDRARSAPVVRAVLGAVDEPSVVITGAIEAAVVLHLGGRVVCAELLGGRPEVVHRVSLVGEDGTIGNKDVIDTNTLARIGQVKRVVVGSSSVGICETIQVPVGLYSQLVLGSVE